MLVYEAGKLFPVANFGHFACCNIHFVFYRFIRSITQQESHHFDISEKRRDMKWTSPVSMDTGLSNVAHCLELGGCSVAEGRMTALAIVEHLDVLEDVLLRFFPA